MTDVDTARWLNIVSGWGTHRRLLLKALMATGGPVLELGVGFASTPYLHEYCAETGRHLVSCDLEADWLAKFQNLAGPDHELLLVKPDYTDAPVERNPWGVALVDHAPAAQRHIEVLRLVPLAQIVVLHDTELEADYHLAKVWPHYRYRLDDKDSLPSTALLSNFLDVSRL